METLSSSTSAVFWVFPLMWFLVFLWVRSMLSLSRSSHRCVKVCNPLIDIPMKSSRAWFLNLHFSFNLPLHILCLFSLNEPDNDNIEKYLCNLPWSFISSLIASLPSLSLSDTLLSLAASDNISYTSYKHSICCCNLRYRTVLLSAPSYCVGAGLG